MTKELTPEGEAAYSSWKEQGYPHLVTPRPDIRSAIARAVIEASDEVKRLRPVTSCLHLSSEGQGVYLVVCAACGETL